MRSMADVSLLAFMGGLEQAVPRFVGDEGVMRQLGPTLGRVEGDRRWEDMLTSGCRTGVELAKLWDTLQGEARETCQYLGEELEGPLAVGSRSGSLGSPAVGQAEPGLGALPTWAKRTQPGRVQQDHGAFPVSSLSLLRQQGWRGAGREEPDRGPLWGQCLQCLQHPRGVLYSQA